MILYHGSNTVVYKPQLVTQNRALDFGSGFYATDNTAQAVSFAGKVYRRKKDGGPVVSVYEFLELIINEYNVAEEKAVEMLYSSTLYKGLEEEETKLWHLSAHALFDMFQEELSTGKITYPEEA